MAFETFITCDGEDCNSRVQVNQPGELPLTWIFIRYVKPNVAIAGGNGLRQQRESVNAQVSKVFCSWRCASRLVKGFVQEGARKE